jgi:hypothetical protein
MERSRAVQGLVVQCFERGQELVWSCGKVADVSAGGVMDGVDDGRARPNVRFRS